jgi:hypothetical protein
MDRHQENDGRGRIHAEGEGQHQGHSEVGTQCRKNAYDQADKRPEQEPKDVAETQRIKKAFEPHGDVP